MKKITEKLFESADHIYADFQAKLMPTVKREKIIGVRAPQIRMLAKSIIKNEESDAFLSELPHCYYDEYLLHGAIISEIRDFDECIKRVDEFLPYVDNWAVCDMTNPKAFAKNKPVLKEKIKEWIKSDKTYTVRFGVKTLMAFFLDMDFDKSTLELVASVKSDEYYINMAVAWFFATALAKQRNDTILYLENGVLSKWVHNKTISKAIDSYRISDKDKEYLKRLKNKK